MVHIIEEASEAVLGYSENLEEALEFIDTLPSSGKYLVLDEDDVILHDTKPGISYKF